MSEGIKLDALTEVVIDINDVKNGMNFFKHFNLEVPELLKKAIEDFEKEPNIETQNEFRIAFCKTILQGTEEIYKDEVFELIKVNMAKIDDVYELEKSIKDTLVSE